MHTHQHTRQHTAHARSNASVAVPGCASSLPSPPPLPSLSVSVRLCACAVCVPLTAWRYDLIHVVREPSSAVLHGGVGTGRRAGRQGQRPIELGGAVVAVVCSAPALASRLQGEVGVALRLGKLHAGADGVIARVDDRADRCPIGVRQHTNIRGAAAVLPAAQRQQVRKTGHGRRSGRRSDGTWPPAEDTQTHKATRMIMSKAAASSAAHSLSSLPLAPFRCCLLRGA